MGPFLDPNLCCTHMLYHLPFIPLGPPIAGPALPLSSLQGCESIPTQTCVQVSPLRPRPVHFYFLKIITTAPCKLNLTKDLCKYGLCYLSKLDGEPIFSIFTPRTKQSAWSLVDTMLTQVKIRRLQSHWDGTWIMRSKSSQK